MEMTMSRHDSYDPKVFDSPEEYARTCAEMDRDHGMPDKPHTGKYGHLINAEHVKFQTRMNDDLGWHGDSTPEKLRKKWGV
jgi:hypothetical protein